MGRGLSFVLLVAVACSGTNDGSSDLRTDGGPEDSGAPDAGHEDDGGQDAGTDHADASPEDTGSPPCSEPGCLRSQTLIGDFSRSFLEPLLEPGVRIDNGYSIWVIEYVTRLAGEVATSRATVAVPFESAAPADGFDIVANAHGTVGAGDNCALSGTVYGSGLAGLFGARGTIGVATDYVGLGTPGLHPYLVKSAAGASVLDSLRAATTLAGELGVATSQRYAVVGLSQGGHAALSAAAMHSSYAPELDIRAFAAAGPASVWLEQWSLGAGVDGPHIATHALLIHTFAAHYGHRGAPLWTPAIATQIDDIISQRCSFDFGGAVATYDEVVPDSAAAVFDAAFLSDYRRGDLSAYPAIAAGFSEARITPFSQTASVAIWQGSNDATVLQSYTDDMVAALRAGGVSVDYRIVDNAGHLDLAFGFVAQNQLRTDESIGWVKQQLDR